ncbi:MAG: YfhO family protein [Flavobacteriales bacterium]|nr:YfhO family protein [Flavobacteriales bacterium]
MDKLKKLLPHFVVLLAFAGISLAYMSPLLQGKELFQSDIVNFLGMSKEIVDFREDTGEEALWTNSMFGGMPAYQISVLYPNNWSQKILKIINFGIPRPANYIFLMLAGAYFMFLMMGVGWRYALIGSVGFAFASYSVIILEAGHNSKAHAMVFMAPVIGSILLTYRGRYLLGAALLAFFLSLEIATNHLQITYYLLLIVLILGAVKLVDATKAGELPNFLKATFIMVIAALIAVGPNISALWTTADYGAETMRGKSELSSQQESSGLDKEYAMRWSYGVGETFTLLIPNFMGGSSQGSLDEKSNAYETMVDKGIPKNQAKGIIANLPLYWGTQPFTSGPVYLGAAICFLAMLGFLVIKTSNRWWLLAAFILSIMLSWGHNFAVFSDFFFYYVPGYNKFRAVSMTLVIAQLILPIAAVLGLKDFLEMTDKKAMNQKLLIATGVVGGICLFFMGAAGAFFDFSSVNDAQLAQAGFPDWLVAALLDDRESLLQMDAMRSLFIILLTAALLEMSVLGKLQSKVALLLIGAITLFDLVQVDKRYLDNDDFVSAKKNKSAISPTAADQQILQDPDPNFRVVNLAANTFNDSKTSYYHKSIGGYHGAKLKRYQELIDSCISKTNLAVLNMLNTKYFITPNQEGQPTVRRNPLALGNAWFVDEIKMVENADQELASLSEDNFNPAKLAVIDKRFTDELNGFQPSFDSIAGIYFLEYKPNYLKYETEAATEQLAVFSEIYFANGWNAYVDGELQPHWRANYVLRSMRIPAGNHEVEFKFEPQVYYTGEKMSLAGSILLVLFVIGGVVADARSTKAA